MFKDIKALAGTEDTFHFMATVVGLGRETKTIVTDRYRVVEVVDGQQRLTTLVILLKALEKYLDRELTTEDRLANDLQELLVKQDDISLILLQTNHDKSMYFTNYLRSGDAPSAEKATILADRELLNAIHECESFVREWDNRINLLQIIKNQLMFIFHEIEDEVAVYTVFEVLNNRGLRVSWLDRLKSMLMAVAFENGQGNAEEHINELHQIWGSIYETIGLRQGTSTEALRFAATLMADDRLSKPLGEEKAVESLTTSCGKSSANAINISKWILKVTEGVDKFLQNAQHSRAVVSRIAQARLLAIAIILRDFPDNDEKRLLDYWEKTSFRIFGLCRKDARTSVGDYVRLSWDIRNNESLTVDEIQKRIENISQGTEHDINSAIEVVSNNNCYEGWEDELRYLMFRYEEYLAEEHGQNFSNEQWARIWEQSAANSIEHIFPQSKGSQERLDASEEGVFVHRLGNLVLLPPGLNSSLQDKDPTDKVEDYTKTGLFCTTEVANTINADGTWAADQVKSREDKLLNWIRQNWN